LGAWLEFGVVAARPRVVCAESGGWQTRVARRVGGCVDGGVARCGMLWLGFEKGRNGPEFVLKRVAWGC